MKNFRAYLFSGTFLIIFLFAGYSLKAMVLPQKISEEEYKKWRKEKGLIDFSIILGTIKNNTNQKIKIEYSPYESKLISKDILPHKPLRLNVELPLSIKPLTMFNSHIAQPIGQIRITKEDKSYKNISIRIWQNISDPKKIKIEAILSDLNSPDIKIVDEVPQEHILPDTKKIKFNIDFIIEDPWQNSLIDITPSIGGISTFKE